MTEPADLNVEHLEVRYGDLVGVADISLKVPAGKVVALLGSNGAGKTTTLNAIAGVVQPARGKVEWRGETISGEPAYAIVSKGLALSPEGWRLFVAQTVEQNLRLGATALADRSRTAALFERVYALFPRLAERRKQLAGTLSGGERQMLALGRALMSEPRLLMLDEPSLGLAPTVVEALYDTLAELHRQGPHIITGRAVDPAGARHRRLRLCAADRAHRARRPGGRAGKERAGAGDLSRHQHARRGRIRRRCHRSRRAWIGAAARPPIMDAKVDNRCGRGGHKRTPILRS